MTSIDRTRKLTPEQRTALLGILAARFAKNLRRHPDMSWVPVLAKLQAEDGKLWSLNEMERTGGEPDVIGHDARTGEWIFVDCSPESPAGRRSVCYDQAALDARKEAKPKANAVGLAAAMDIELLDEEGYRALQRFGEFDTKTSSWIATPRAIRTLGGALFADRRYDHVFVYHNGAQSYYAARGFRGSLRI
jgi:hypothetical protein